ncbi:30S ribosomal protein S8 [Candidatus Uhrbacteria bacterium CG_4_9_14_3_um_filter_36_7]|uniref:Small ribosomal subunit protein uS8 n=1 Tax=Candidatus Uhrbacteria bacterium CG_4_9_14_3_um_filter_36_7 TaxID=1975033 RepID=A0A2M7XHC4_9BACT|nr:MAG: 30S ribosomal protein S8 [Candidatus Uhrbacteria bacterium CG_4_9_14_3_um_filter_36_7]
MITDPISDMLTRIRNAQLVKKAEIILPFSSIKQTIAKILEKEQYVHSVYEIEDGNKRLLRIVLSYGKNKEPRIQFIKRVSTPGRRVYAKFHELPYVRSNMGIAIISTSNGLMTNKEARTRHLGGEVICEVY